MGFIKKKLSRKPSIYDNNDDKKCMCNTYNAKIMEKNQLAPQTCT